MPDVYRGHAEALVANGDAVGSHAYLRRTYDTLMRFAAQIRDPAVKEVFLAYPLNAGLVGAWKHCSPLESATLDRAV